MKCQNCGMHNMEENKFCQYCGSSLEETAADSSQDNLRYAQHPDLGDYDFGMPNGGYGQHQAYGYTQGYGYQSVGNVPAGQAKKKGNGIGIAALVCGILSLLFFWVFLPGWILGTAAVVLGIIQCVKRKKKGLGIAGIILGVLAFVLSTLFLIGILAEDDTNVYTDDDVTIGTEANENAIETELENGQTMDLMNMGTFSLVADWEVDVLNSDTDLYMYVPEGTDVQYVSDVMTAQSFEIEFVDVDELISWNKNEIANSFGTSPDDIAVYINEEYELPIVAFQFKTFDTDVQLNMEIWEYHVVVDGKIAIFISFDYDDIEDESATNVKDCAFEAAKSFRFN